MSVFVIYKVGTGEIVKKYTGSRPQLQCGAGEAYCYLDSGDWVSDVTHRIDIDSPGGPVPVLKEQV